MARITVEDCLEHVENRFQLVTKAAERAHQFYLYNAKPMVDPENDKYTVIALREIANGTVVSGIMDNPTDTDTVATEDSDGDQRPND